MLPATETNHTNTHAQKRPSWRNDPVAIPTQVQAVLLTAQEDCARSVNFRVCERVRSCVRVVADCRRKTTFRN